MNKKEERKGLLITASYMAIALVLWMSLSFGSITVSGLSMYPTLNDRDIVVYSRLDSINNIGKGDIVICRYPNEGSKRFIKRVVGKGGDKIEIKDGLIYINGKDRTLTYFDEHTKFNSDFQEIIVPEGSYFVIGDNVNDSMDSRMIGCIDQNQIIGVVVVRVYPNPQKL